MVADPYTLASTHMATAGDAFTGALNNGILSNINAYLDPYRNQVLNAALGRMDTTLQQNLDRVGDAASAAGAYGGSRHGVVEGTYLGEHAKNVGELTANINSDAWKNAFGFANQDWNNNILAADRLAHLGGQYFNTGNIISDRQMLAGSQQQQLNQQILTGGADQYKTVTNHPYKIIEMFQSLLASDPRRTNVQQTTTATPGIFDYLSLAAQLPWG